jgi:UDP-N-acetylmuramoyl-L-alanyl-D-glutamate--2,6-diaminopimelate ligase
MSLPPALRPAAAPSRPLRELIARLPGAELSGRPPDGGIRGVTHDSRAVRPGDLYAALPGEHAHGATFAEQAAGQGAVAVLTDPAGASRAVAAGLPVLVVDDPRAVLGEVARWVYGAPGDQLLLIGVTGTNGKTTTTYLVESGLRAAGYRTGLVGTVQTLVAGEAVPSVRTTPEASDLHGLLALMRERGVDAVVMEVSSHALALRRVDGLCFDAAVFTNLSQDHLDFHRDMADYFAAKARLFTPQHAKRAVLNVDDRHGRQLAAETELPRTTFSAAGEQTADYWASDVATGSQGSTFRVHAPDERVVSAGTTLLGQFNAANALAAVAALVTAGVELDVAAAGVAGLGRVPGRLDRVEAGQPFLALVDYAHTPEAVHSLLAALRPLTSGRVAVVLGCGGDRDRGKRPLMGAAAVRGADLAVFTSDNPRSEDPDAILAEMMAGAREVPVHERAEVLVEANRRSAIATAVARCRPGDTLVVAGKGHEQGQEYADRVLPFDDRAVLRAALLGAGSAA